MIAEAIASLRPGAEWQMVNNDLATLEWLSSSDRPSDAEIAQEAERLQSVYDSLEFQRLRAKEYPTFADQFDLLYHGGFEAWKAAIDAVKAKYPKPLEAPSNEGAA